MKAASRKGFTLIEILIVVIILGILAAIVIPQFTNASEDAKLASLQSTVQSVQGQIELYKLQHDGSVPGVEILDSLIVQSTYGARTGGAAGYFGPYLPSKPAHPFSGSTTVTASQGATANWSIDTLGKFQGFVKGTWYPL